MSNFPTSDITQHQSQINYPRGVYEHIVDDQGAVEERSSEQRHENDVMMVYSAQIWLRVILNEAHNALYGGSELLTGTSLCFMLTRFRWPEARDQRPAGSAKTCGPGKEYPRKLAPTGACRSAMG
jgi:hypothetical protein